MRKLHLPLGLAPIHDSLKAIYDSLLIIDKKVFAAAKKMTTETLSLFDKESVHAKFLQLPVLTDESLKKPQEYPPINFLEIVCLKAIDWSIASTDSRFNCNYIFIAKSNLDTLGLQTKESGYRPPLAVLCEEIEKRTNNVIFPIVVNTTTPAAPGYVEFSVNCNYFNQFPTLELQQ